jgi:hypothetical protein
MSRSTTGSNERRGPWRVYEDDPAPGMVEVGLERVEQRGRLWWREAVVRERVLGRRFLSGDVVARTAYRGTLRQALEHMSRGTFGSYVDVDALTNGVRVRLVRRTIGARHLHVDIARERIFGTEAVADSAAHAAELRAVAEEENEAYWAAAREAAARASDALAEARRRAHDAAELSRILRSQEEEGS